MKRFTKIASLIMAIAIVASTLIIFPVTHDHVHALTGSSSETATTWKLDKSTFGKYATEGPFTFGYAAGDNNAYSAVMSATTCVVGNDGLYTADNSTRLYYTNGSGDMIYDLDSGYSQAIVFVAPVAGSYTFTYNIHKWETTSDAGAIAGIYIPNQSIWYNDLGLEGDASNNTFTKNNVERIYTKTVTLPAGEKVGFYGYSWNKTANFTLNDLTVTYNGKYECATKHTVPVASFGEAVTYENFKFGYVSGSDHEAAIVSGMTTPVLEGGVLKKAAGGQELFKHNATERLIMLGDNSYSTVIEFTAPHTGSYTYYANYHKWGTDTNQKVSGGFKVLRSGASALENLDAGDISNNDKNTRTGSVNLTKGDKVYFYLRGTAWMGITLNDLYLTLNGHASSGTCKTADACDKCGIPFLDPDNHEQAPKYVTTDTTHSYVYPCCNAAASSVVNEAHRGGTATCLAKAKCEVCEAEYGSLASHTIKYEQTATQHKEYCDFTGCEYEAAAFEDHTWNNGACGVCNYACLHPTWDADGCTVCGADCDHDGGTATCTSPKICEKCEQEYGAKDMTNHTSTVVIYDQNGADGHIAKHDCCKEVIAEDTAHVWNDEGACSKCEYECQHPTSTVADCQNESVCTVCGLKQGDKDMTKHVSEELTWTKTEAKHSAVHACCNTEAVAEADHTLVEGKCSVCQYVSENAVGTKYKLDINDLGSTTDKFEFFVTKNAGLTDLTKLDRVLTAAGAGWAGAGTGIAANGETVNSHFWKRDAEPQAGQMVAHIENGTYRIIAFKAPVNGEYTYNVSGHNWGKDNNGKIYIKSYRSGEAKPIETHYPEGDVRSDFTGKVELGKGGYLYLVFSGDIAENFMNVYDVSVTLNKKLNKAPDKIVDVANRIGDFASFPVKNFSFYTISGLTNQNNYAGEAIGKLSKLVPFTKVVDVKYGDWTGKYLDVANGTINGFTAGYSDIQFVQSAAKDLGLLIGPNQGEVLIIKYTVPADGKYSYMLSARDLSANSNVAVMDVNINGSNNWWDMMKITGASHAEYKANQSSSQKELKKGDEIYFIFRVSYGEGTVVNVSDFAVVQHGVRVPATGDNTVSYVISALVLFSGAALVIGKKRRNIEK